ncbi:MAG: hypothetical protein LBM27_05770 [Lactobacillaceae bacterium]|nr:hypothetical protein [Lactobacillaceae bacterium]
MDKPFGPTIKKIRLSKSVSQKELYGDIISKSFAIDFEAGKNDIKFASMLKIISQLGITIEEFLYIHNDYHQDQTDDYLKDLKYRQDDSDAKHHWMAAKLIEDRTDLKSRLRWAQIMAVFAAMIKDATPSQIEKITEARELLRNYLFENESWTFSDIGLYASTIFFLERSEDSLFKTAWETLKKYRYLDEYTNIKSQLFGNKIYKFIDDGKLDYAEKLILEMEQEFSANVETMWIILVVRMSKGLVKIARGDVSGVQEATDVETIFRQTDNIDLADQIKWAIVETQKKRNA